MSRQLTEVEIDENNTLADVFQEQYDRIHAGEDDFAPSSDFERYIGFLRHAESIEDAASYITCLNKMKWNMEDNKKTRLIVHLETENQRLLKVLEAHQGFISRQDKVVIEVKAENAELKRQNDAYKAKHIAPYFKDIDTKLEERSKKLTAALKFYADQTNWRSAGHLSVIEEDDGDVARKAIIE